jgi:PAS domain S-box-containing protein
MHISQLDRRMVSLDRGFSHREVATPGEARPFEEAGLALRVAPFLGLTLVALIVVPFTYGGITTDMLAAWLITALVAGSAFLVPWARLPASWQALPPLALYLVAALVRDATGGASSVFTALVLLPVVWLALYGTLAQVLMAAAGCALAIGLPVLLDPANYSAPEFGRAALDALMTGALGVTGIHLVQQIRERDALSRSILDSAHAAFLSIDEEGRVLEWSAKAERDFGWSRAEAIGKPLTELILADRGLGRSIPGLQAMLEGDRRTLGRRIELTAARHDGTEFPIELAFFSLTSSEGTRFNAFVHDISERRANEAALHEANQRFRSAFDDAAIGMAIVSPDGRWQRINRALAELTGYSQEQLLGMGFGDITHPDDRPADLHALKEMLDGTRDRFQTEKRYIHADGHVLWTSLSMTIVRDDDGRPMYLLSQMQDISERKATEARLAHRASHDQLTGLPNRGVLEDRMVLALNRQRRERRPLSVLYLDLDGF